MKSLKRVPMWINVYEVTREYGGPEEGGWWYDCETPMGVLFSTPVKRKNEARRKFKRVVEIWRGQSTDRFKILGGNPDDLDSREDFDENDMRGVEVGSDYIVRVERVRGGVQPRRPHYE